MTQLVAKYKFKNNKQKNERRCLMKNKIRVVSSALSVALMTLPAMAMAQFAAPTGTNLPEGTVTDIIKNIMNWILGIVGVLGVIGFAIAGVLYLTAAGDETKIDKAKQAMTYSIIGVIVALVGLVVIRAASSMLGGSTSTF
jgi:cytochrome bd-type quinol oxidase subunit 2